MEIKIALNIEKTGEKLLKMKKKSIEANGKSFRYDKFHTLVKSNSIVKYQLIKPAVLISVVYILNYLIKNRKSSLNNSARKKLCAFCRLIFENLSILPYS